MKSLVVYFSPTGNTELAARKIAEELGSDIEDILDTKRRKSVFGMVGAVMEIVNSSKNKCKWVFL